MMRTRSFISNGSTTIAHNPGDPIPDGFQELQYYSLATCTDEEMAAALEEHPPTGTRIVAWTLTPEHDPDGEKFLVGTAERWDRLDLRLPVRITPFDDDTGDPIPDGYTAWVEGWAVLPDAPTTPDLTTATEAELRAEIERLNRQHREFQSQVVAVTHKYAVQHQLCEVVDQALGELGLEVPRTVTFTATVTRSYRVTTNLHPDRSRSNLADRDFIRQSIVLNGDELTMDSDWTDTAVSDPGTVVTVENVNPA